VLPLRERRPPAPAAGKSDHSDQSICAASRSLRAYPLVTLTSTIDDLDARLIALLREEPRLGLMEASRRLGVARGTVQARLAKLEDRGVVRSFGPEVDPGRLGYPVLAFVFLQIAQGRLKEAVSVLESTPEVLEATATSGPSDLLCRIVAQDTEHLQEIVNRLLSNNAIRRSTSYIALSQPIGFRTGPLVAAAGVAAQ
jgi:DNA-binding Lrp family transcriptional regulator